MILLDIRKNIFCRKKILFPKKFERSPYLERGTSLESIYQILQASSNYSQNLWFTLDPFSKRFRTFTHTHSSHNPITLHIVILFPQVFISFLFFIIIIFFIYQIFWWVTSFAVDRFFQEPIIHLFCFYLNIPPIFPVISLDIISWSSFFFQALVLHVLVFVWSFQVLNSPSWTLAQAKKGDWRRAFFKTIPKLKRFCWLPCPCVNKLL